MNGRVPFGWADSPGWLALSGGAHPLSEIRAAALSRCGAGATIAYISQMDDMGDALMDDLAELGAPSGYLVDLDELDNNEIYERVSSAGLIVIEGDCAETLRRALTTTVAQALRQALAGGAVLLCEGAAASLFGERRLSSAGNLLRGLDFVQGAVILSPADADIDTAARLVSEAQCQLAVISLQPGAALALGPAQQIEAWGSRDVTIRLSALDTAMAGAK